MKILAISDVEDKYLWDYYEPGRLDGYDLILSAGDLDYRYLEFLATFAKCPIFYVPGNHDEEYAAHPPQGCECIDGKLVVYRGVRILGLGGCNWYRDGTYMLTEQQMMWKILHCQWDIQRNHGFDILLTHSPARGVNDGTDLPHQGFKCFNRLRDHFNPKYHIYGHVHPTYFGGKAAIQAVGDTRLINAYGKVTLEL